VSPCFVRHTGSLFGAASVDGGSLPKLRRFGQLFDAPALRFPIVTP
jgi:hypothetical protein